MPFPPSDGGSTQAQHCELGNQRLPERRLRHRRHRPPAAPWFATEVYASSKDLRVTQELLGHSHPATTPVTWPTHTSGQPRQSCFYRFPAPASRTGVPCPAPALPLDVVE